MTAAAVIAAAGEGARMGGPTRKQYLLLEGIPVLARSVNLFSEHPAVNEILVVIPSGEVEAVREFLKPFCATKKIIFIEGGTTRQESVAFALAAVSTEAELICIHDAVRPLATPGLLDKLIAAASVNGTAVPVIPPDDTVKEIDHEGRIVSTPDRSKLRLTQTPQVFRRDIIIQAFNNAAERNLTGTDDSALVEQMGLQVLTVPGELSNLKITSPQDLILASVLLKGEEE